MSGGYGSSWDAKQERILEAEELKAPLEKSSMICQCGYPFKLTTQGQKYCDWCFVSRGREKGGRH